MAPLTADASYALTGWPLVRDPALSKRYAGVGAAWMRQPLTPKAAANASRLPLAEVYDYANGCWVCGLLETAAEREFEHAPDSYDLRVHSAGVLRTLRAGLGLSSRE